MIMECFFYLCPAEKKLVKPTEGVQTGKLKDSGRSQVVSKEQRVIKKKKPLGKNWIWLSNCQKSRFYVWVIGCKNNIKSTLRLCYCLQPNPLHPLTPVAHHASVKAAAAAAAARHPALTATAAAVVILVLLIAVTLNQVSCSPQHFFPSPSCVSPSHLSFQRG